MADAISKAIDRVAEAGSYWWSAEAEKDIVADRVNGSAEWLMSNQRYREVGHLRHLRLYGNAEYRSLAPDGYMVQPSVPSSDRLRANVIAAVIDTGAAKIAKNKPRPMFITNGGSFAQQRRAKNLSKFVQGVFYENQAYVLGRESFRDGEVFGSGFAQVYSDDQKRICIERVFTNELMWDDWEARWGNPRTMYRVKAAARDALFSKFPKSKLKIESCPAMEGATTRASDVAKNMVRIVEAWHLPTAPGREDGRHVIVIKGCTLLDEVWKRDRFPLAKIDWKKRLLGYLGMGLAEALTPIQVEINKILIRIQEILHLHGVPAWFVPKGAAFHKDQLNNAVGNIYTYEGTSAPTLYTPAPIPPDLYHQLDWLWQKAFEQEGMSQLSASSQKPDGLDSGAALREYNDIESERFVLQGQAYEEFFLDLTRLVIDEAEALSEQDDSADLEVRLPERSSIRKIKWSDVRMDEEDFILQVFPVSMLPNTPAGRLQRVDDLVARGYIGADVAMELLDFPDLEAENNLQLAAIELTNRVIEGLLEGNDVPQPDPMMNLQMAIQRVQAAYLHALTMDTPESTLERLRTWMLAAVELNSPPAQAQPGAPAQPGMPDGSQPQLGPGIGTPPAPPQPGPGAGPSSPTAAGMNGSMVS